MTWEAFFSALPLDERMRTLLGSKRYEAWLQQGRPQYPQFVEPQRRSK
jgi:hypothetical protein